MTDAALGWVRSLCGAGMVCAVALALCPSGRVRDVLKLAVGAVMCISLLSPLLKLDLAGLGDVARRFFAEAETATADGYDAAREYERALIESECEAYILDKARALGLEPSAIEVTAAEDEDGGVAPRECSLTCAYSAGLSEVIASELGIPPERQRWEEGS